MVVDGSVLPEPTTKVFRHNTAEIGPRRDVRRFDDVPSDFWASFGPSPVNDWLSVFRNPVDSDLETGALASHAFFEAIKSISAAPKRGRRRGFVFLDQFCVLARE